MDKERLAYLFSGYYNKTSTPEERIELMDRIDEGENDSILFKLIDDVLHATTGELELDNDTTAAILQSIVLADKSQPPAIIRFMRRVRFRKAAAAAAVLFLILTGGYFYFNNKEQKQIVHTEMQPRRFENDVAPGGNKAILTLSNGKQIILDSAANGTITKQGNTKILKLNDGQIAYNAAGPDGEVLYNTISTPKGGQYQVELADGSKVWLNAASSLRFPISFTGKKRDVELTGEGYFEVVHNAAMPFHVRVNDMTVEVLGTHFNINAYTDEARIKTTLLEGSVKVIKGSASKIIKPGEQAITMVSSISTGGQLLINNNVDVDEVMAWKNGKFDFHNADLTTIMRQMSRWYNVDVIYNDSIQDHYTVDVKRDVPVSQLFKFIEMSGGVHFEINGRKIIVTH